ncbi:MAG: chemotaxis protein CheC [Cellulosilyticaceae bacterium]
MEQPKKLSFQKLDILREAGNIGAGNAVTALSELLHKPVDMSIAEVKIKQINELSNVLGQEEDYIVAMLIEVDGDINGMLILALETPSAHEIVDRLLDKQTKEESFNELESSVLCETGNILAGSYLSALSTLTNMYLNASVPQMAMDMAGAILSFPAIQFMQDDNTMMFIETRFTDKEKLLNGIYLLVLDENSLGKITEALGKLI